MIKFRLVIYSIHHPEVDYFYYILLLYLIIFTMFYFLGIQSVSTENLFSDLYDQIPMCGNTYANNVCVLMSSWMWNLKSVGLITSIE